MTMNEAIILATELGGAYIARIGSVWRVLSRAPSGPLRGLIWVAFDGTVTRV